jgi:hypothetical protein
MYDSDKPEPEEAAEPVKLVTTAMGFQHQPGFEAAAYLIIGMDKDGQTCINMPNLQPHLCLHLATMALQKASQLAVLTLQQAILKEQNRVVVAPAGAMPPWNGLSGRG